MVFRNEYWFLSNMYPCTVTVPWGTYKCAESAFQAAKCANKDDIKKFYEIDGFTAKKLGRQIDMRNDWSDVKVDIMKTVVAAKFSDITLAEKLTAVKEEIVEDNTWNDTFWGRCNGVGENNLGKILAEVREEIIMKENKEVIKIGVTEAGDPTFHEEWIPKMKAGICSAAIIVTKGCLSDKGQAELLAHPEKYVLHATMTGLGGTALEKNVMPWQKRFQKLVEFCGKGFPKDHVVIRTDPIIPVRNPMVEVQQIDVVKAIITTAFQEGFRRFRYSFVDVYYQIGNRLSKTTGSSVNIRQAADCSLNNPLVKEFIDFALEMEKKGCTFGACAETDVPSHHKKGCISEDDFVLFGIPVTEMAPAGSNTQRNRCMCPANKFELLEHKGQQCPHGCAYCYQAARQECKGDCANCKSHCSNKKGGKTMRKITIVSGALNPLDTNQNFGNAYINADPDIKMPNTGVIVTSPPYNINCVMNAIKNSAQVVTVRVKPENVAALSRALLTAGFEVHVPESTKGAVASNETKEEPNIFDRTFGASSIPRKAVVNQYSIGVSEEKGPAYVMIKPVLVTTPVTPVCESILTGKETWDVTKINSAIRCCGALAINRQHVGVFSIFVDDATARDIEPNFRIGTVDHQRKVVTEVVKRILLQEKKITPQDSVACRIFHPGKSQDHHIEGNKEGTYFSFSTFCAETQSRVRSMYNKFLEEHATVYYLGVTNRNAEIEQLRADIEAKDAKIAALEAALAAAQSSQAAAPVVKKNKKARRMPDTFKGLNIQALIDQNLSTADVAAMIVKINQTRYDLIAAADGTKAKKAGAPRSFLGCSVTAAIKRGLSFAAFIEEVKASLNEQNEQDKPIVTGDNTPIEAEDGGKDPAVEAVDDPKPQENVSPDAEKKDDDGDDPEDPKGDNDPTPKDKAPSKKGSKPRINFSGFGFASGKKAIEIVNGKQEKDEQKEHKDPVPETETAPNVQDKGDNVSTTPNVVLATYEDPDDETWEQWYKTYGDEKFVRDYYEVEVKKPNALQSVQEVDKINKEAFEQAQTNLCCLAGFFFGSDKAAFVKGLNEICDSLRCDVYIKNVTVDNDGNVFVTLPVSMGSNTVTVRLEKHDDRLVTFQR